MRIRRAADYSRSRWKNGGGETIEIAIAPPGASLDQFDWRVSMALVATDGPFSVFAGVDRTIAILEGAGIALTIGDAPPRRLDSTSAPFAFSGDLSASARLVNGPATDFNVMTRRSGFSHTARRVQLGAGDTLSSEIGASVVFCHAGILTCTSGGDTTRLESSDALVIHADEPANWSLVAETAATLYVVAIFAFGR